MADLKSMQKFGDSGNTKKPFIPSPYQQAIFDWICGGEGHAIINAVAGSGKTTTLIESIKHCYETAKGRILFLAFNKAIAEKLGREIPFGYGATSSTFNAFGWGICRDNVPGVKMDRYKDDNIFNKIVDRDRDLARYNRLRRPVLRMVSLLKSLNQLDTSAYEKYATTYGVELGDLKPMDRFQDVLATVYRQSISDIRTMNFDDQLFQPIFRNWSIPAHRWVLIDEIQDASPVNIEMAKRLAENGRLIGVGDPDQSIYLFRGAHPDAMATMARDLPATMLPLSVCYRCPDAVIEAARKQVPRIEAPSPNPNGKGVVEWISTQEFRKRVAPGDVVLCRTTAPLVKRCLQDIRDGRRAFVQGRDVGKGLVDLIEKIHGNPTLLQEDYFTLYTQKATPAVMDLPAFLIQVSDYYAQTAERLDRQNREAELIQLDGNIETIKALAEESDYTAQLIKKIEEIFDDEANSEAITYKTGHRCKGEEYKRVFLLRLDLCPHPRAKSALAKAQDKNILYVMKSRSQAELYYVKKEAGEK